MNKRDFLDRLCLAGKIARDFAASYLVDDLPEELCFTIRSRGIDQGTQGLHGTIKFIGGRFLRSADLQQLKAQHAASLLWVDGKVPAWINIGVGNYTETHTELVIRFCSTIVPANEYELPPDYKYERGNPIAPFRIRGPGTPEDWRSVRLDGRVPMIRDEPETNNDA